MKKREEMHGLMLDKEGKFYYVDCENWDKNNKEGRLYHKSRK